MKKFELDDLIDAIKEKIEYYERFQMYDETNYLKLANGDGIRIKVPNKSVPHLLGIDTNYLISTGLYRETSSYEILKKMCDDSYRLYNGIKDGVVSEKQLFSEHFEKKLSSFTTNLKINILGMQFACPYDREKTYNTGMDSYNFDYILVKKSPFDGEGIFMLGLGYEEKYGCYVPMSNQYFDNLEEFEPKLAKILTKQEVTIPVSLQGSRGSIYLSAKQKYDKTQQILGYADTYGAVPNVAQDYTWCLSKYSESMNNGGNINNIHAQVIQEKMSCGQYISPKDFGLADFSSMNNPTLVDIISAYNDSISRNIRNGETLNVDVGTNNDTYNSLLNEVAELRKIKAELLATNNELTNNNKALSEENERLNSTVDAQSNIIEAVKEAVKVKIK